MRRKGLLFVLAGLLISGCATVPRQPQVTWPAPAGIYHIVGSGQNLYRISQAYGVSVKEIMRANNIQDANQIGVGERLFIPGSKTPACVVVPLRKAMPTEPVEKIIGRNSHRVKWRCITLHHSATLEGNAESFDRNHRRRGMGGLFYHFIIDNGTCGTYDGEIEVGWRWRKQKEVNRRREIEICLVGNFSKEEVSAAQFNSLVKLLKVLTKQYSIPLCNIRRHKDIRGKITECPGDNFPLYRLLVELRKG